MSIVGRIIGLAGAIGSVFLSALYLTTPGFALDTTFIMCIFIILPAILVIYGSVKNKGPVILIALIWTLFHSYYFSLTPGVYKWFGLTVVLYLASGVLVMLDKKVNKR
ncbi:hypothetical protein LCL95_11780 [Bacillus timonensis]|nr:hypothetical protein [Bacillus timonensis]